MSKSLIFALLTLLAGGGAMWGACRVSSDIRGAKDWPTTPGTISERGVGAPMTTEHRMYLPRAVYTYEVAGKKYTNDQVYLIRGTGGTSTEVKQLVDELPTPTDVHYDPDNPQSSYLVVNPMGTYHVLLAFAIGALVLGALQLLVVVTKTGTT